ERWEGQGESWSVLPDWEANKGYRTTYLGVETETTHSELRAHFTGDDWFTQIIDHVTGQNTGHTPRERRRVKHRAQGFLIEDGKLWRLNRKPLDRTAKAECIPTKEGLRWAMKTHTDNGHFGWEHTKLS
ncbi:hypothetical protein JB92DRAFT_2647283, partial [Gautieria morchelliformis]